MMSDKAIWAIATELISAHGTKADRAAGLCLSQAKRNRKDGDATRWLSVLLAVEELLKAEPDNGEWTN